MGQQRRYVSTDPNFGEPLTRRGERKYVSTDPNFGVPLRTAPQPHRSRPFVANAADYDVVSPDDVEVVLRATPINNRLRAALWDIYETSQDPDDLAARLKPLEIPQDLKAQLWDLKSQDVPQQRYLSTDPNDGEPVRPGAGKYLSTDPFAGEPLRGAQQPQIFSDPFAGEPLRGAMTWSDRLGLNEGTASRAGGFLRGSGSAAVDMLQGAIANLTNQANRHRVEMRTGSDQPAPDVMTQPESVAGTIGAVGADMALPGAAGVKGGSMALNAIPRVARAGEKFQEVMGAAKHIPIDVKNVGDVALRIHQLSERGGSLPLAVRKLLNRMTDPNKAPMVYEESRDFASNISRLSANEFGRLTPAMAREVANLRVAINEANAQAAKLAGKGAEYKSAMREYAQAMRLKQAMDAAVKRLPLAAGAGAAYWLTRQVRSALGNSQ